MTGASYAWFIDTFPVATGTVDVPANGMATVDLPWIWTFARKSIRFHVDSLGAITETEEANNDQPRLTCPGTMSACKTLGCCIEEARLTK